MKKIFHELSNEFYNFSQSTSIHGFVVFGDFKKPFLLRVVWAILTFASLYYAGHIIFCTVDEWNSNPIQITVLTTDYPVEKIPFPTITICRKQNNPNGLRFISKVLNQINFPCYDNSNCSAMDKTLEFSSRLFSNLKIQMEQSLKQDKFKEEIHQEAEQMAFFDRSQISFIQLLINIGKMYTIEFINGYLIDMFNLTSIPGHANNSFRSHYQVEILDLFYDKFANMTYAEAFPEPINMLYCYDMPDCNLLLKEAQKFITKIDYINPRPYPPLGTIVSQFSELLFSSEKSTQATHLFMKNLTSEFFGDSKLKNISAVDLITLAHSEMETLYRPYYILETDTKKMKCQTMDFSTLMRAADKYYTSSSSSVHPCQNVTSSCCNFIQLGLNLVNQHFDKFLKFVKISYLSDAELNEDELNLITNVSTSFLSKKNLPLISPKIDSLPMIMFCNFESKLDDAASNPCSLFHPVPTVNGICQSFNFQDDFEEETDFWLQWSSVFKKPKNTDLVYPVGFGVSNGLYLVLNSYEAYSIQRLKSDTEGIPKPLSLRLDEDRFVLSVSNSQKSFDIFSQTFFIEKGQRHTLKLGANKITTSSDFDNLDKQVRNCSLPTEKGNLSFFKEYSKISCNYECAMHQAAEKCFCIPWNMPRPSMIEPPLCDMLGNFCFFKEMAKNMKLSPSSRGCNCPDDCQKITYTISESKQSVRYTKNNQLLFRYCEKLKELYRPIFLYEYILYGRPSPYDSDFCNELIKEYISVVKIEMATESVTVSRKERRISFENQLSSLGGTLGLFLGMSLLSAVEVIIWVFKSLYKTFLHFTG